MASIQRPLSTACLHGWRDLLARPDRQWRAGYSALAAAQSWESGFPPEVARLLGDAPELQLAIAEHKVQMPAGGFASQCDVFALARAEGRDMAVAVEAKVDETFGPSLGQWLENASENKRKRISTLCDWLGITEPNGSLRYQLFHRSAAAIVEARRFHRPVAAMIVQSFSPTRKWFCDFAAFCDMLGLSIEPDKAAETELPCGLTLRLGWACGDPRHLESHMKCDCKDVDCECK